MTLADTKDAVVAFFREFGDASLKLPDGWFGRPFDNLYKLTGAHVIDRALQLELNSTNLLTVSGFASAKVDGEVLLIAGFDAATWRTVEFGTGLVRSKRYEDGVVELVALPHGV